MNLKVFAVLATLFLLFPGQATAQGPYPGEIMFFAGSTPPQGWHECDGSIWHPGYYPELCTQIGTLYGAGANGYCQIPDARGKVLVGWDDYGDIDFANLGNTGGAKTHTLTKAEMPNHNHTVYGILNAGGGSTRRQLASGIGGGEDQLTSNEGNNEPHNNMPPYLTVHCLVYLGGASAPTPTPSPTPTATNTPTPTPTLTATPVITNTPVATGTAVFLPQMYGGSTYTHTLQSGNVAAVPLEISAGQLIIITSVLSVCGVVALQLVHKVAS